jgi:hypothetical protein
MQNGGGRFHRTAGRVHPEQVADVTEIRSCSALIDKLNVMGSNGWELVSIINHPDPDKFYTNSKNPFFAILKKPIS